MVNYAESINITSICSSREKWCMNIHQVWLPSVDWWYTGRTRAVIYSSTLRKICENMGFHWPVFSSVRAKSIILSLYGGIWVSACSANISHIHCVKNVQILIFIWSVFFRIRTRKNPAFWDFSGSDWKYANVGNRSEIYLLKLWLKARNKDWEILFFFTLLYFYHHYICFTR